MRQITEEDRARFAEKNAAALARKPPQRRTYRKGRKPPAPLKLEFDWFYLEDLMRPCPLEKIAMPLMKLLHKVGVIRCANPGRKWNEPTLYRLTPEGMELVAESVKKRDAEDKP